MSMINTIHHQFVFRTLSNGRKRNNKPITNALSIVFLKMALVPTVLLLIRAHRHLNGGHVGDGYLSCDIADERTCSAQHWRIAIDALKRDEHLNLQ